MSNQTITDETALLIVSCGAAIQQQLYLVMDLLNEQARVLKRLVGKRIRPTTDERRRFAPLARKIERRILAPRELNGFLQYKISHSGASKKDVL